MSQEQGEQGQVQYGSSRPTCSHLGTWPRVMVRQPNSLRADLDWRGGANALLTETLTTRDRAACAGMGVWVMGQASAAGVGLHCLPRTLALWFLCWYLLGCIL